MLGSSRREFLTSVSAAIAGSLVVLPHDNQPTTTASTDISLEQLQAAAAVVGAKLTEDELKAILPGVRSQLRNFLELRKLTTKNSMVPATTFRVLAPSPATTKIDVRPSPPAKVSLPPSHDDLSFASIPQLAALLRGGHVTSVKLTEHFLDRLKTYGPKLRCVVTLTPEVAMAAAKEADAVLKTRQRTSLLHGIPYGVKDLFAVPGYPTTWGAEPYRNQQLKEQAWVVEKLNSAGGVLVAKLSLGALAMGDVWFAGRTESPWDSKIGSSGSSAGSASATAAGLVPYAIGTETSGSIVSPSHNCRVTGMRPTFGSVGRSGAMTLSWTMDKVGPICRSAEECAIVLASLLGQDPGDPASISRGLEFRPINSLTGLRFGYFTPNSEQLNAPIADTLPYVNLIRELGADLKRMTLPRMHPAMSAIITAECAAAFDDFTMSDAIDNLKNSAWPASFRQGRFISALDHIQLDRMRRVLMEGYEEAIRDYDVILVEDRGYPIVYAINLTGHPQILVPFGTTSSGAPMSFSLIGPAFREQTLLQVADLVQRKSGVHLKRPDMSGWR